MNSYIRTPQANAAEITRGQQYDPQNPPKVDTLPDLRKFLKYQCDFHGIEQINRTDYPLIYSPRKE